MPARPPSAASRCRAPRSAGQWERRRWGPPPAVARARGRRCDWPTGVGSGPGTPTARTPVWTARGDSPFLLPWRGGARRARRVGASEKPRGFGTRRPLAGGDQWARSRSGGFEGRGRWADPRAARGPDASLPRPLLCFLSDGGRLGEPRPPSARGSFARLLGAAGRKRRRRPEPGWAA